MKSGLRGGQWFWVASRCWPLSSKEGRGKSLLETNISKLMAESAVSLSFEQDWTCLSEGELTLDNKGYRRMEKNTKL